MKVLHLLSTSQRRGAEIFTHDLVPRLSSLGVRQHVALLRDGAGDGLDFPVPTTVLSRDGRELGAAVALRGLVARLGPDVIQAHGGDALKYALPSTMGLAGTRVAYRRIGSAHHLLEAWPKRVGYGWLMRRAASVICVGRDVARQTEALFRISPARLWCIPNAVDPARIRPRRGREEVRRAIDVPVDAPLVLSVGALTWEKDPLGQIGVARQVVREHPEATFAFVGRGPLESSIRAVISRAGLDGRVRLLGARTDVPDLLAASDVLLLASRTEGMPGIAIEAGMLGVPVAGFAIASVPEVVLHGRTGVLVEPQDHVALAAAVVRILRDDESRRRMGREAREWCLPTFDIGVAAPRYLEIYERIAVRSGRRG